MRTGRPATLAMTVVVALTLSAACSSGGHHQERSGAVNPPSSDPTTSTPPSTAKAAGPALSASDDWLTYHHDAGRSGVAGDQGPLGAIRKAWTSPSLDGKVYAQPLIAGDLVIVATEGDSVYALARDSGAVVWRAALGQPVSGRSLPCGNIDPSGITGTPVVDAGAGTVDVVAFLADGPHHELFALDLASGAVRWHRPVDPPGLSAKVEQVRGAAALSGGRILVP